MHTRNFFTVFLKYFISLHCYLKKINMLTRFAVTNYRGFDKKIELDLSSPNNYSFNQNSISNGIIKNGIIYGPNGVGKTNFGLALFDIEYHLAPLKAKKSDYYDNFIYAGKPDSTVDFEYTFKFDGKVLEYKYSKSYNGKLKKESLYVDNDNIFCRDEDNLTINAKQFPNANNIQTNFLNNANSVSVINYLLAVYPLDKDNYLLKLQEFVNGMLWFASLEFREFIGVESNQKTNIEEYIISNNLTSDFTDFLERISEQKFEFVNPQKGNKTLWYKVGNSKLPFCLTVSTGTRTLELLYFWLKHMNETTFVFIDEFDAFYHFKLAFNICKELFNLPCQLFLSSHNTYLMTNDLLRPDCNFIIDGKSIKSLSNCTDKELRFGHNIEKIYRAGAFYEE